MKNKSSRRRLKKSSDKERELAERKANEAPPPTPPRPDRAIVQAAQCALLFLFSAFLAQRVLLSWLGQDSDVIVARFAVYVSVVLILQTAVCAAAFYFSNKAADSPPRWRDPRLLPAAFLVFNFLGLFLSYTVFAAFIFPARMAALAILFLAVAVLMFKVGRQLFLGLALLAAVANAETGFRIWQKLSAPPPPQRIADWRQRFPAPFNRVQFVKKPNVYLVSWDALAPPAFVRNYMRPTPPLAYADYLNGGDFRVFKNVFTDRGAFPLPDRSLDPKYYEGSRAFHNSLLFFDPALWDHMPGDMDYLYLGWNFPGQFYYFAGRRPSPLYEIFKENGYRVFASYEIAYFGDKGPHIDRYLIPNNQGQCRFAPSWVHFWALGFCQAHHAIYDFGDENSAEVHMRALIPALKKNAEDDSPWLNFIYINSPGHAPSDYLHLPRNQRGESERLAATASGTARHMKTIVDFVRQHDPQAAVLFMGDHGLQWARRGFDKNDMSDPARRTFYFLDVHAVMAAAHPPTLCREYFNFETPHTTPSMLTRALVQCLSGGQDPVSWKADYDSPYAGIRFADYLYE